MDDSREILGHSKDPSEESDEKIMPPIVESKPLHSGSASASPRKSPKAATQQVKSVLDI